MELPNRKTILRKLVSNASGFTFVETIIAFSIVGIFLALTWGTVTFLLTKTTEQIERTRGHFLAVEGVELVRQIRLTALNRNRETGYASSISNKSGNYAVQLQPNGEEYKLVPSPNEQILVQEDPYTLYCRKLSFSTKDNDPHQKVVTSTVRWGDSLDCSKGDKMVAYSTLLADMTQ